MIEMRLRAVEFRAFLQLREGSRCCGRLRTRRRFFSRLLRWSLLNRCDLLSLRRFAPGTHFVFVGPGLAAVSVEVAPADRVADNASNHCTQAAKEDAPDDVGTDFVIGMGVGPEGRSQGPTNQHADQGMAGVSLASPRTGIAGVAGVAVRTTSRAPHARREWRALRALGNLTECLAVGCGWRGARVRRSGSFVHRCSGGALRIGYRLRVSGLGQCGG